MNEINNDQQDANVASTVNDDKCDKCQQNPCVCTKDQTESNEPTPNNESVDTKNSESDDKKPKISWI